MKGLIVPEQTEDFTADPVELFFDLAFVFAFSQIVHMLVVHPDWEHVGKAGMIFLLLWLPWTQFTWSANAVPGNQRSIRLAFLIATVATVPIGAAVETAFDGSGVLFAIPLAVIFVMALAVLLVGVETGSEAWTSAVKYFVPNLIAMVVLVVGGFLQDEARYVAWGLAIVIVIGATISAGGGEWMLRPGHFAERHGLIIIVALGEVVVALGRGVAQPLSENEGAGFSSEVVIALVATGVAAGLLFWSYFDRVQPAVEHRAEALDGPERARFARDAYSYGHAPIVAGIILIAVGFENAALHPTEPLAAAFRAMLFGGIALFVIGVTAGAYRAYSVIPIERLGLLLGAGVILAFSGSLNAVWLIVLLDVLTLLALGAEHYRIERRPGDTAIRVRRS